MVFKPPGDDMNDKIKNIFNSLPKHTVTTAGIGEFECVEYYDVPTGKPIQSVPSNPPKHMSTIDIVFIVFAFVIASIFIYMMIVIFKTS
jgi:hypothetical protein